MPGGGIGGVPAVVELGDALGGAGEARCRGGLVARDFLAAIGHPLLGDGEAALGCESEAEGDRGFAVLTIELAASGPQRFLRFGGDIGGGHVA